MDDALPRNSIRIDPVMEVRGRWEKLGARLTSARAQQGEYGHLEYQDRADDGEHEVHLAG